MNTSATRPPDLTALDPALDLSFERIVNLPRGLIWKAWTQPQQLMPGFRPAPEAREHGLQRRLAHHARPAGRVCQNDVGRLTGKGA
jgi:uncharacterized protein YndB with AHSA1/START domain